jgi:hypothetical protein
MTVIVVHPRTRDGFIAERLRKAAEIRDLAERQRFLGEAIEKYRLWAIQLGVPAHKVGADTAILRCAFFPRPGPARLRA